VRIFLDTNVLASAVATRGICADVFQVALAEHQLVVGEKVLTELHRVLQKKFRATLELADETDGVLRREAEVFGKAPRLGLSLSDADDVVVLEQAVAGQAEVFVTGERGLLEAELELPLRILSPRGFWDLMRTARED
jgi:putative PIN family toxin of toxin-antitoxin system